MTFFSSKYVIKNIKENQNWLLIEFQEKDDSNVNYVCNVYGPTHYRDKQSFWNSLIALKEDLKGKDLIIVVDFNVTKTQIEKRGSSRVRDPYGENMEDLIFELDLLDPPLKNIKFTWSNRRLGVGYIAARLDRFLVSTSFLQKYIIPTSFALLSAASDHKSISLVLSTSTNLGPIPFCFNSSFLHEEKVMGLIKNAWILSCVGSPSFIWENKLRNVRYELKEWVKMEYKNPSSRKSQLQYGLVALQSKMENEEITFLLIGQEKYLNHKIHS